MKDSMINELKALKKNIDQFINEGVSLINSISTEVVDLVSELEDIRVRLGGAADSKLDGEDGLVAATMRELRQVEKERDFWRNEVEKVGDPDDPGQEDDDQERVDEVTPDLIIALEQDISKNLHVNPQWARRMAYNINRHLKKSPHKESKKFKVLDKFDNNVLTVTGREIRDRFLAQMDRSSFYYAPHRLVEDESGEEIIEESGRIVGDEVDRLSGMINLAIEVGEETNFKVGDNVVVSINFVSDERRD